MWNVIITGKTQYYSLAQFKGNPYSCQITKWICTLIPAGVNHNRVGYNVIRLMMVAHYNIDSQRAGIFDFIYITYSRIQRYKQTDILRRKMLNNSHGQPVLFIINRISVYALHL